MDIVIMFGTPYIVDIIRKDRCEPRVFLMAGAPVPSLRPVPACV